MTPNSLSLLLGRVSEVVMEESFPLKLEAGGILE
jgi:hypothetical protein